MDLIIKFQGYTAEKQAQLASTGLCGYALDWWYQTANTRRQYGEQQISSWYEMKAVMKKRFVAKRYGQTDLERMHSQSGSAKGRARTPKDEPRTYYGGEAARKLQLHQAYLEELQSPQFKQQLRNMVDHSLTAVVNIPQKRSVPRPASRADELSCYQKEPAEKKEETAAKQGERALEPATSCQGDYLHNDLKQEERSSVICDHVPGQNKAEEGVLNGSPKAHELAVITVVQEGDIIKSFSCDLLIKPPVWIQTSIVDHLKFVKGLQHLVFEPGGSFCVHKSITSNLIQIAAALKLELEGFLHDQEEPMLVSGFSKLRPRAQKSKIKACSWYQWGKVQSEAVRSKLNNEKEQCALSVVCNGNISPGYLRHVRGLQFFVFEPGGELYVLRFLIAIKALLLEHKENGSIILQGSDLRTNPFKGGGDGVAMSRDIGELSESDEGELDLSREELDLSREELDLSKEEPDLSREEPDLSREEPDELASLWTGPVTRLRLRVQVESLKYLANFVDTRPGGEIQDKPACWFNLIAM